MELVVDPAHSEIANVGACELGIYRTADGGEHWLQLDPTTPAAELSGRMALDPNDPHVLFAGTFYEGLLRIRVP